MKIEIEIDTNHSLTTIKDLVARYTVKKIQLIPSTVTGLQLLDCINFLEEKNEKDTEKIAVGLEL